MASEMIFNGDEPGGLRLPLDETSAEPLYRQLYHGLRRAILEGQLAPGSRLPAGRALAARLGVARVTVTQAYAQLSAEGLAESRRGAGTFVSAALGEEQTRAAPAAFTPQLSQWGVRLATLPLEAAHPRGRLEIDFGFGRSFTHIFPYDIWRRLLARYLSTDDVMLSRYGSAAGFLPLRQALADYLGRQRGLNCTPEQVIIVSGAQQALDILARLLLRPGDEALVETPGYSDAFALLEMNGATLVPMPVDEEGFPVERLAEHRRARLAFVTPAHQFPRGGTLPLGRRQALLAWAEANGALIIEDDYDGELRYDGHPLSALQGLDRHGHVVYLGTFSKVLFPALRLGYVVLPPALVGAFSQAKGLVDRGAPTLTQAAVADFIAEGHFERHLRRLRAAYGERRAALEEALQAFLPDEVSFSHVPAGLHIMAYLNPACGEIEIIERAAAAGVGVYPGRPYHLQQPAPPSILLGFSGLNTEQIHEGVRRLAEVIPHCR